MKDVPSKLPHPDGTQRVLNVVPLTLCRPPGSHGSGLAPKRFPGSRDRSGTLEALALTGQGVAGYGVLMGLCAYCRKETELYDGGTPVCVECADARAPQPSPAARLTREVAAATERADAANAAFHALMRDIPSSVPHPDGSQRLHNAASARAHTWRARQ